MKKRLSYKLYNILFGQHSNIPECCIDFFIGKWLKLYSSGKNRIEIDAYHGWIKSTEKMIGKKFGYIPCPDCITNLKWVKVHTCTTKCKSDLEIIDMMTGSDLWEVVSKDII